MAAPFRFFLLGSTVLLACFAAVSESHDDDDGVIQFGYSGSNGPDKWGSTCANGKAQSPINIVTDDVVKNSKLKPLVRYYHATNATLINNGYNIGGRGAVAFHAYFEVLKLQPQNKHGEQQLLSSGNCWIFLMAVHALGVYKLMKYNHDVGVLNVEGKNYTLAQMHWHTPSEHQIDGEQFPAELHLVHMGDDGTLAVVGILFNYGKSDPLLSKLKDELEELGKEKCQKDEESMIEIEKVNVKYLRKNNKKFYRYIGSLTTPPCSENVMWNILTKVKTISKDQVELLQAPLDDEYKKNCRPVQPLNSRKVELYNKSEDDDEN